MVRRPLTLTVGMMKGGAPSSSALASSSSLTAISTARRAASSSGSKSDKQHHKRQPSGQQHAHAIESAAFVRSPRSQEDMNTIQRDGGSSSRSSAAISSPPPLSNSTTQTPTPTAIAPSSALWSHPAMRTLLLAQSGGGAPPPSHYAVLSTSSVVLRPAAASGSSGRRDQRRYDEDEGDDDVLAEYEDEINAKVSSSSSSIAKTEDERDGAPLSPSKDRLAESEEDRLLKSILDEGKRSHRKRNDSEEDDWLLGGGDGVDAHCDDVTLTYHHKHHTKLIDVGLRAGKNADGSKGRPSSVSSSADGVAPSTTVIPYASSCYLIYSEGVSGGGSPSSSGGVASSSVGSASAFTSKFIEERVACGSIGQNVTNNVISETRSTLANAYGGDGGHSDNNNGGKILLRPPSVVADAENARTQQQSSCATATSAMGCVSSALPTTVLNGLDKMCFSVDADNHGAENALRNAIATVTDNELLAMSKDIRPFFASIAHYTAAIALANANQDAAVKAHKQCKYSRSEEDMLPLLHPFHYVQKSGGGGGGHSFIILDPSMIAIPAINHEQRAKLLALGRGAANESGKQHRRTHSTNSSRENADAASSSFSLVDASSDSVVPRRLLQFGSEEDAVSPPSSSSSSFVDNAKTLTFSADDPMNKVRQFYIFRSQVLRKRAREHQQHLSGSGGGKKKGNDTLKAAPPASSLLLKDATPRLRYADCHAEVTLLPVAIAGLGYAVEAFVAQQRLQSSASDSDAASSSSALQSIVDETASAILGAIYSTSEHSSSARRSDPSSMVSSSPSVSSASTTPHLDLLESIKAICDVAHEQTLASMDPSSSSSYSSSSSASYHAPMRIRVPYLSDVALVGAETLAVLEGGPIRGGDTNMSTNKNNVVARVLERIATQQEAYIARMIKRALGIEEEEGADAISANEQQQNADRQRRKLTRDLHFVDANAFVGEVAPHPPLAPHGGAGGLSIGRCAGSPLLRVNVPLLCTTTTSINTSSAFPATTPNTNRDGIDGGMGIPAIPFAVCPRPSGEVFALGHGRDFVYMTPPQPIVTNQLTTSGGGGGGRKGAAEASAIITTPTAPSILCDIATGAVFVGTTCGRRVWSDASLYTRGGNDAEEDRRDHKALAAVSVSTALAHGTRALRTQMRSVAYPLTSPLPSLNCGGGGDGGAATTDTATVLNALFPMPRHATTTALEVPKSASSSAKNSSSSTSTSTSGVLPLNAAQRYKLQQQQLALYYKLLEMITDGGEFKRSLSSPSSSSPSSFFLRPATALLSSGYGDLAFTADSGIDSDVSIVGNATNPVGQRRVGVLRELEQIAAEVREAERRRRQQSREDEDDGEEEMDADSSNRNNKPVILREVSDIFEGLRLTHPFTVAGEASATAAVIPALLSAGDRLKRRYGGSNSNSAPSSLDSSVRRLMRDSPRSPLSEVYAEGSIAKDMPYAMPYFTRDARVVVDGIAEGVRNVHAAAGGGASAEAAPAPSRVVADRSSRSGADRTQHRARDTPRHRDRHCETKSSESDSPSSSSSSSSSSPAPSSSANKKVEIFTTLLRKKLLDSDGAAANASIADALVDACNMRSIDATRFVEMSRSEVQQMVSIAARRVSASSSASSSATSGASSAAAAETIVDALEDLHKGLRAALNAKKSKGE